MKTYKLCYFLQFKHIFGLKGKFRNFQIIASQKALAFLPTLLNYHMHLQVKLFLKIKNDQIENSFYWFKDRQTILPRLLIFFHLGRSINHFFLTQIKYNTCLTRTNILHWLQLRRRNYLIKICLAFSSCWLY